MKTTHWSERSSPRSTGTSREESDAHLYVHRIQGAIKRRVALPWEWHVNKGDRFRGPAYASMRGRCATENEAQRAADAALPLVVRAFTAFGVER